jgi:predicted dithiol-disulfide oxidoreductase (DUF899 family)
VSCLHHNDGARGRRRDLIERFNSVCHEKIQSKERREKNHPSNDGKIRMKKTGTKALPRIVSAAEWQAAREKLLVKEKAATRAGDALAAERRRLPMVRIEKQYLFEGPDGKVSLLDLFEQRRQLIIYHFMFAPDVDGWPAAGCPGCSFFVDQIGHLSHLHARDTSFALISRAPRANILAYKKRMGWTVPWFSSAGSDFNVDFGLTSDEGEYFGLSVFLRDGESVFRTYFTSDRAVEAFGTTWSFLDLTPFGRQEEWEDSPEGWPQTPPYQWWRRHDEYGGSSGPENRQ